MKINTINFSQITDILAAEIFGLQGVYLFGSYANGCQTEKSDLDLAVLADKKINLNKLEKMSHQLSKLLRLNQVDLIDLKAVNTIFQEEILKTGQRIATLNWFACETYEDYIYCKGMGFREWRKPWLEEIKARGSIYG